jgi:hypothetical protein
MSRPKSGPVLTVGAQGSEDLAAWAWACRTHPNHSSPRPPFTTKGNFNSENPKERLRTTQSHSGAPAGQSHMGEQKRIVDGTERVQKQRDSCLVHAYAIALGAPGGGGQAELLLKTSSPARSAAARRRSEAVPVHVLWLAMIARTALAIGSASMTLSMAALAADQEYADC